MAKYPTPPGGSAEPIAREFRRQRREQREQARPTGSQVAGTVSYLASLINESDEGTSFDSGSVAGTATNIQIVPPNPPAIVGMIAATGRLQITSGCGEVSIRPGNGSAIGYIDFRISDPDDVVVPVPIPRFARIFSESNRNFGVSLSVIHTVEVPTDVPLTIRGRYHVWSTSTAPLAAVTFNDPYVSAQVLSRK